MLNTFFCFLLKLSIIWLCFLSHQIDSKETDILNPRFVKEILYYHNIYRYLVTVGNIKSQPTASDMQMMKWNQTMALSIMSMSNNCILKPTSQNCPEINVHRLKNQKLDIEKIVRRWFNGHRYYNYAFETCGTISCQSYKRMLKSETNGLGCIIKRWQGDFFFICQYSQRTEGRPYKAGVPCSSCSGYYNSCFKSAFCINKNECLEKNCESLIMKSEEHSMQADQPQFCLFSNVNCNIKFYLHMCPVICSSSTILSTTQAKTTTRMTLFIDNEVCRLATVDCSITFFKILCPKSCEGVLCRDPNIDCRNIFYRKCQQCQQLNEKMSDSKITSTTMASQIENSISLDDPKCQDLPYDSYCIDRGEMCFHNTYKIWMKKFCCNTCKILDVCFDYLDLKTSGKCAAILSSGMCSSLWSQTYCRKTCKKC